MTKNMGGLDRIIRLVIAAALGFMAVSDVVNGTAAIVLCVIAIILALTSLIGVCPAYKPFGFSTGKRQN